MKTLLLKFIAGLSEELLLDLFKTIVKEFLVNRKKGNLSEAVDELQSVIDEVKQAEGLSIDEKNSKLIDAGRPVINSLRDK